MPTKPRYYYITLCRQKSFRIEASCEDEACTDVFDEVEDPDEWEIADVEEMTDE